MIGGSVAHVAQRAWVGLVPFLAGLAVLAMYLGAATYVVACMSKGHAWPVLRCS